MNRQLLESTFLPDQVKQRSGSFGKTLDYIEGHSVIKRLNDAFDGCWSFEILSHEILEDEVIVKGSLSAEDVIKTQFGGSSITRAKDTGAIVNLADDLKAAATDSLKKCATMLGVGLYLYGVGPVSAGGNNGHRADHGRTSSHAEDRPARSSDTSSSTYGNGRISNKQLSYLIALGKDLRLDSKELDRQALELFGVRMAYLTRKDASAFIDQLKRNVA